MFLHCREIQDRSYNTQSRARATCYGKAIPDPASGQLAQAAYPAARRAFGIFSAIAASGTSGVIFAAGFLIALVLLPSRRATRTRSQAGFPARSTPPRYGLSTLSAQASAAGAASPASVASATS
jgi:hypothetical protein